MKRIKNISKKFKTERPEKDLIRVQINTDIGTFCGHARCAPCDEFVEEIGMKLALKRAVDAYLRRKIKNCEIELNVMLRTYSKNANTYLLIKQKREEIERYKKMMFFDPKKIAKQKKLNTTLKDLNKQKEKLLADIKNIQRKLEELEEFDF